MASILTACESALLQTLQTVITGTTLLVSDESEIKPSMPYVILRAKQFEEQISPGSGIFKVSAGAIYRSHVKDTTPEEREAMLVLLNNFAYNDPAGALSQVTGFHCYGFVNKEGAMEVEDETKSYAYNIDWDIYCMPRNNV